MIINNILSICIIIFYILICRRNTINASKVLSVMCVAILHILTSGFDQFVDNVVKGNGMLHQVSLI